MDYLLFFVYYFLPPAVIILTAIWAYNDIKKFNVAGIKTMDAASWSALIVILWIIMFPLYIIIRFAKYKKQLDELKGRTSL